MAPRRPTDFQPIHFRFTHQNEDDLERFIRFILSYSVKTLCVFEDADEEVNRPHLHTIIYAKETLSNFRKQFKKKFPNYGRGDYGSCIIEHPDKMERYLCKGKSRLQPADLRLVREYDMDIIDIRHTEYWDENDRLRSQTVDNVKKPKSKAPTWMQLVNRQIREEYPTRKWGNNRESRLAVYDTVMQCLGKEVKKISPKIVRELCDGQLNNLAGYEVRSEYWQLVYPNEYGYP